MQMKFARMADISISGSRRVAFALLLIHAVGVGLPLPLRGEDQGVGQGRVIERPGQVIPWRERVQVVNDSLAERLGSLLPVLMREVGIDMWLVVNREYAEDPVYFSLVPAPVFAARRTTMLVFFDRGKGQEIERLTVNRYPLGELYEPAWEGGDLEEQWSRLAQIIRERDPKRIGINVSRHWPVADGLTAGLRDRLAEAVGSDIESRFVSSERSCYSLAGVQIGSRAAALSAHRRSRQGCDLGGVLRKCDHTRRYHHGRCRLVYPPTLFRSESPDLVHARCQRATILDRL